MANPTVSSEFTDLYASGLRRVMFENFTARREEYSQFLNVGSSKKQFEEDYRMAGFGSVPKKLEGTNIVYDDPVPDTKITWTWNPYGKGFRVTHEAMMDDLYGPMKRMAASLGKAFRNQVEIIGANVLNSAFTAVASTQDLSTTGFDSSSLCVSANVGNGSSHAHVRTGTTFTNAPSTAVALGVTALQDALINFEQLEDESDVPIVMTPRLLIVDPTNAPLAGEILGSQFKPFTADNEINVIQDAGLQLMVSHYLTTSTNWFLLANKGDHDLWFVWREKFQTGASDDFDSGDGKMKGYMRCAAGWGEWRGIYGSPGV